MVPASPLPETVTILRRVDDGQILVRSQKDDAPASFPIVDISAAEHFSQSQPTESLNRLLSDREFDRNKYKWDYKDSQGVQTRGSEPSRDSRTWGDYTVYDNSTVIGKKGLVRGTPGNEGYMQTTGVGGVKVLVHVIVASAWFGQRPKGQQINHIDGYRYHNTKENLEWCTPEENMEDMYVRQCTNILIRRARLVGITTRRNFVAMILKDFEQRVRALNTTYPTLDRAIPANERLAHDRKRDKEKYTKPMSPMSPTMETRPPPTELACQSAKFGGHAYQVYSDSSVWRDLEEMHGESSKSGYVYINRIPKHIIVAKAWCARRIGLRVQNEVNHKDGYRSNNMIENLEWCTSEENNENKCERQCINVLIRQGRFGMNLRRTILNFRKNAVKQWKTYNADKTLYTKWTIDTSIRELITHTLYDDPVNLETHRKYGGLPDSLKSEVNRWLEHNYPRRLTRGEFRSRGQTEWEAEFTNIAHIIVEFCTRERLKHEGILTKDKIRAGYTFAKEIITISEKHPTLRTRKEIKRLENLRRIINLERKVADGHLRSEEISAKKSRLTGEESERGRQKRIRLIERLEELKRAWPVWGQRPLEEIEEEFGPTKAKEIVLWGHKWGDDPKGIHRSLLPCRLRF